MSIVIPKCLSAITFILLSSLVCAQHNQYKVPELISPFSNKTNKSERSMLTPAVVDLKSSESNLTYPVAIINGSVYAKFEKEQLSVNATINQLNTILNLNEKNNFIQTLERTDDLGITHRNFQQYFDGYLVEDGLIMIHSKHGIVKSINGRIAEIKRPTLEINVSPEEARTIAELTTHVKSLLHVYPINSVVIKNPNQSEYLLAYKVRIDSFVPFFMCYVYVDAKSGKVVKKVNLNAHADVPGTGQTIYSGVQALTCDSYQSSFRLRESVRNIQTFNATNATDLTSNGFTGSSDFTSSTSNFAGLPLLTSFTVTSIAQSWWYSAFIDEIPDLYIKVKNGSNQTVYTSNYFDNLNPPCTFSNLNIPLTDPPYLVEVYDFDASSNDDFAGSYNLLANTGNQTWSGSGNSGSYLIGSGGHLATDVHWGMELTYDFYLNTFNRDSYDGNGSIIKQYINSPLTRANQEGDPNNAFAMAAPYNIMVYGLGDGLIMNPVVGLDVEGHEFTHLVVANNGNGGLTYEGESGALNESFADIFGACVEFYSEVNPDWNIGEGILIGQEFLRSMSNPNAAQQPDTYNGINWANPMNLESDHGGVHINSGVQNFWFYLLTEGGSGVNDLGNSYLVNGIGIDHAGQIAYRNLTTYLGPSSNYLDAYNGSLQSAQDLYGVTSAEYNEVRKAWYAVGIGNDPNASCSGTSISTSQSGIISDGSGSAEYGNNANCKWVIAPPGATQISLNFTSFSTEANYDFIYVYDGPDDTSPLLATWWGNTLPSTINTTPGVGAMCVKFTSDDSLTEAGWSANYTSVGQTPTCQGATILSSPTGSFGDGSGAMAYGNNQTCYWIIAPPCANSVSLSFTQFNTELNYDGLVIFDDLEGSNQIALLSGTNIPGTVISNTGVMIIVFLTDFSNSMQGFSANYNSQGSAYCEGVTTLNGSDFETFSDGSSSSDYCSNMDCQWLIQPPQATSVTINFTSFDLEPASLDGQTIFDAVEIFDGTNTSAPLLGRFTGNSIPLPLTSSSSSMLLRFYSDLEETRPGWSAYYTSTQNEYCTGNTTLTANSGTFSDGSSTNQYANNSQCTWLIQPENATSITLSFSSFQTESDYDGVVVYDGVDNSAPIIGSFSGPSIPSPVTSSDGAMFIEFLTGTAVRDNGWTANYTSTTGVGVKMSDLNELISLFPNPSNGVFNVSSGFNSPLTLSILDVLGQETFRTYTINNGDNQIDASFLAKGIYLLKFDKGDCIYVNYVLIN